MRCETRTRNLAERKHCVTTIFAFIRTQIVRTHVSLMNIKDWIAVVADDILKIGGGGQGNTKDTKPRPGGDF